MFYSLVISERIFPANLTGAKHPAF